MGFTYLLLCKNGDVYKGTTNDLQKRFAEHCKGKVEGTKDKLPVSLICFTALPERWKAFVFEKYLKSGSGRAFISKHFL